MRTIALPAVSVLTVAALAVTLAGGRAAADTYSLFFNKTFSATDPQPANAAPWLTAVFEDVDEDLDTAFDYVKLTLAAPGLAADEFSADWYFNNGGNGAAEATKIAGMTATYLSGTAPSAVNLSQNAYKADGDGKYDLNITFPQGNSKTLVNGQTSAYKLTGVDVAFLKDRLSLPEGGHGPFLAAAHIQGLATGESVWVHASKERDPNIVPEAGVLQFAAFAGLGALAPEAPARVAPVRPFPTIRTRRQAPGGACRLVLSSGCPDGSHRPARAPVRPAATLAARPFWGMFAPACANGVDWHESCTTKKCPVKAPFWWGDAEMEPPSSTDQPQAQPHGVRGRRACACAVAARGGKC